AVEILLLEENSRNDWWAMMRPAKRARVGTELSLLDLHGQQSAIVCTVLATNDEGHRRLRFAQRAASVSLANFDIAEALHDLGEMPLPPYIKRAPRNSS